MNFNTFFCQSYFDSLKSSFFNFILMVLKALWGILKVWWELASSIQAIVCFKDFQSQWFFTTEPNGGEGENCGEFKFDDWTKGRWNDNDCNKGLTFVCEKKGQNYIPPPTPSPPEPKCPDGWRKIRDRCLFLSSDSGQQAANWTEARAMCKGFHEGSTLVSIRDQVDQDAFNGMYGSLREF